MTPAARNMLLGSIAVSAVVGIVAILDMATGMPFARQMVLDSLFVVSAGLIGYMGFSAYREMS